MGGGFEKPATLMFVAKAGVDNDAAALEQHGLGPAQALAVRSFGPVRRIDASIEFRSLRIAFGDAGQLFAHDVAAYHVASGDFRQVGGQGGLAGAGQTAHQQQTGASWGRLERAERQQPIAARFGQRQLAIRFGNLRLDGLHAVDLAAHRRPIAHIERQQFAPFFVASGTEVRIGKCCGQVGASLRARPIVRNAMSATGSAKRNRSLNSMQSTITRSSGGGRSGNA